MKPKLVNIADILALGFLIAGILILWLCSGCAATRSVITEYDSSGCIVKTTETSESVIKTVTASTQNKTVVMWEDGWAAYISASSGTTEDPTPHGKLFAGKTNKGAISILPDQRNLPGIARIVQATKSDIGIGLAGLTATSSEVQQGSRK